jgi:hypothetical protein
MGKDDLQDDHFLFILNIRESIDKRVQVAKLLL